MKKATSIKLALVLMVSALVATTASANRGRARTMVDRLMQERRSGRVIRPERLEFQQRKFEQDLLRVMRTRSGLSRSQLKMETLREYVGKFEGKPAAIEALAEFLGNLTARGAVTPAHQQASGNVLAQILKLSKREGFMIEPRDLVEMNRNWSIREMESLGDILLEARSIQQQDPSLSHNKAFERALENRGLLEKFRRRCK